MLTKAQVSQIIETERKYQDETYNPNQLLISGQTRGERDLDVAPGLVLLDAYVRKAQDAWTNHKAAEFDEQSGTFVNISADGSFKALQQIAKIAAIACRILERAGGSEALLNNGLR